MGKKHQKSDDRLVSNLPMQFRDLITKHGCRQIFEYAAGGKDFNKDMFFAYTVVGKYTVAEIDYLDGIVGFIADNRKPVAIYKEIQSNNSMSLYVLICYQSGNGGQINVNVSVKEKNRPSIMVDHYEILQVR